jgi:RIO kinase 1
LQHSTHAHDDALDDNEYDQPIAHAARHRKSAPRHRLTEFSEGEQIVNAITMTYHPALYEEGWLKSSLRDFYTQHYISDVLALVKGGKEASVYCCAAHPRLETDVLAAKVYRPRMFRNLRNDKMYREGRSLLTDDGRPVKPTDDRLLRAVGKKTAFGVQVEHTSWLMHEYTTLRRLFDAGARVPEPIAACENAILMRYIGDINRAAPTLQGVTIPTEEAPALFAKVMESVELMLSMGFIHGDLSAYNILYWEGEITLIDFPQVTDSYANRNADFILKRDITRVCEYFARYGVACDPAEILRDLWDRYIADQREAYLTDMP